MKSLNFNYLFYFWMVVREGSVTEASKKLFLAQPTVSAQIRKLEKQLGEKLLERVGRNLLPTEKGWLAFRYAEEIFSLGNELVDSFTGLHSESSIRFAVGVSDSWPKLVTFRLLEPVFRLSETFHVSCQEGKIDLLLEDLAAGRLDVVFSDFPITPSFSLRAYNHSLGESTVSFFGVKKLAEKYRKGFPDSLDKVPLLMPTTNTVLRLTLDQFFSERGIQPTILADFEDSALLNTFGQAGMGLFPSLTSIKQEICKQYDVEWIGAVEEIREQFYAISPEKKVHHPAVATICEYARKGIFNQ
jgi:LysR family transcriptional activator of nhaA